MYTQILNWHGFTKEEAFNFYTSVHTERFLKEESIDPDRPPREKINQIIADRIQILTNLDFDPKNTSLFPTAVCGNPECGEVGTLEEFGHNGECPHCGYKKNILQYAINKFAGSLKYIKNFSAVLVPQI